MLWNSPLAPNLAKPQNTPANSELNYREQASGPNDCPT